MAKFNEILTGRHNNFIKKLFSMKGDAPAPQLASEIMFVHPISHGKENRFLEEWRLFSSAAVQVALAANNSGAQIRNPLGSRTVVVIERLSFNSSLADTAFVITQVGGAGDLPTVAGVRCLDNRVSGNPVQPLKSQATVTVKNNLAASGGGVAQLVLQAGVEFPFIQSVGQELTLLPGDSYQFATFVQNTQLVVNFLWRERLLEDSEVQ